MRLSLTNEGDYAVRAVLDIARHHPELRTTREIAAAMDLPRNFMTQILATLVRHGLLRSAAGPAGGYTLARPPNEVTLLDVIDIIEGPLTADECILGGGSCDWTRVCPLHEAWAEAKAGLLERLSSTTFDSLAHIDRGLRAGTYEPPDHAPPHRTTPPRRGISDQEHSS